MDFTSLCAPDEVLITKRDPSMPRLFWLELINTWAADHNVEILWQGEWTHRDSEGVTDYSLWHIPDDHARTLFILRWA